MNSSAKRIAAILLAVVICFVMLFSAFFILSEAQHDCCGDGCIICAQISRIESSFRTVLVLAAALASVLAACCFIKSFELSAMGFCAFGTPVQLKVRLLN